MSPDEAAWAERNWWDPAGAHFASTNHDALAVYLTCSLGPLGPLPLDRPPSERDVLFSGRVPEGYYVLHAVAKLGVALGGEVVREWTVDPAAAWWGQDSGGWNAGFTVEVRDRFGSGRDTDWVSFHQRMPVELVRSQACRVSRLIGDVVVWTRVLGRVDMH